MSSVAVAITLGCMSISISIVFGCYTIADAIAGLKPKEKADGSP